MKQLIHRLKDGKIKVLEVPIPDLRSGMIMVRNYYSLISPGTEGSTVKTARKGYIGKARERPQQVKQVIETLKTRGPMQTYLDVKKKLENYSPLGYSCVGEVIGVAPDVESIRIGDLVACGGSSASHAEVVVVPRNLCVQIQKDTDLKAAAYNTLGTIALQGIRQADLRIGECCTIIGLGLLGQLTALLLKASAVKVIGIDIEQVMVDLAINHGLDLALVRNDIGIETKILEFTNNIGCDAVIITAASDSLDPINFAGAISRKKGTIVVVGSVPTGFDRGPHYYKKELTVKMSCSYGPGRYDPEYEEKGHDYPVGYVRWTEKRNMQAFQELISQGKINISCLTTYVFKLEDASNAYNMIVEKLEPYLGILIAYDREKDPQIARITQRRAISHEPSAVTIGFIGAGSYAQSYLLPNIPKNGNVILKGVMTATSTSSRSVADRFGFEFCSGQEDDILKNSDINTVFIATRHDSHGYYVKKALEAGKHVFVEKPLAMTLDELEEIKKVYKQSTSGTRLMLGFNRRFAPHIQKIKSLFGEDSPKAMNYRINAGKVPIDHWIHDKEIGGGRIIGEVCHFVDLTMFLAGAKITSVSATVMQTPDNLLDTLIVNIGFENGSVANISYFSNGSKKVKKEYLEVFSGGQVAIIDDFRKMTIYSNKISKFKLSSQDKGHSEEVRQFIRSVKEGNPAPIAFDDIYLSTLATFKICESIRNNNTVIIT